MKPKPRRSRPAKTDSMEAAAFSRRAGIPLHRQIYVVVRDAINRGQYRPGALLPGEDEWAARFGVSRVTVRTAMAALEADSLIQRRQGKGTYVRDSITVEPMQGAMADLIAHMRDVGSQTEVTVLEFDYGPLPLNLQAEYNGDHEAAYQHAVRLRSRDGRPLFHITTYIPEDIGRTYSRAELGSKPLIELLRRAKATFVSGTQTVTATVADPTIAARLQLAIGDPLLLVKRRHFNKSGRLVQYLEMLASPTVFELRTELGPPDL